MQSKEPSITTAHIALICSVLGWVSWGVIAIPGVIIAHMIKSQEPSTAIVIKAALRVGYTSILIGLAGCTTVVLNYLGIFTRLQIALGLGEVSSVNRFTVTQALVHSEESNQMMVNWAWIGGIFLVTMIVFVSVLPLFRKGYASFQSAKILRSNSTR